MTNDTPQRRGWAAGLAIAVLLLAPLVACWPILLGFSANPLPLTSGLLSGGEPGWLPGVWTQDLDVGVTTQALGHLAAEQWLHGEVPWWNPYNGIGMPLAGEMQGSALFLPFVLLLHFENGPLILKLAMQMLAGLFSLALLRRLGASWLSATIGALLFGLSGCFAWLGHGPIMPVAFLPLLLLGIEQARSRPGGSRVIAVALAFSLIAGFPETAYLDGLLALGWAIGRFATTADRWRFARRVIWGGLIGLALASPAVWSFAHLLLNGTVANHAASDAPMPALQLDVLTSWLFPFVFGPILAFSDPADQLRGTLPYLGGYLDVLLFLLALLGLFGRRLRALRFGLAAWIVLGIGGVLMLPVLGDALYALPLLRQTIVARYAIPSWHLAAIVLAVLAIEDWRRGERPRYARLVAACCCAAITLACLAHSFPLMRNVAAGSVHFWRWPVASVVWGATGAGLVLWLTAGPATYRRVVLLAALLALDAAVFYSLPLLSAPRDPQVDKAAVQFLKDHTGLQRFYTLGPYHPNYGAYFETAQLNHEYLPIPANWAAYIPAVLDPSASVIMFRGDFPPLPPGQPSHGEQMLRHLDRFEALGVRYIVTPPGENPFVQSFATDANPEHGSAHALAAGHAIDGTVEQGAPISGGIDGIGVEIGTYNGQSNGTIEAELCTTTGCAEGKLDLATAADNAVAMIPLDPPLPMTSGEPLRWRFHHSDGEYPVAIWLPPGDHTSPRVHFTLHSNAAPAPQVYRDATLAVYELPNPAPYFQAFDGPCRLEVQSRTALTATCNAPATLVRRELFYPGWRAEIGDTAVEITKSGEIMQQIALPAGTSSIRFRYAPPYARLCWALVAIGLLVLLPRRSCPD
jgi:hypothetical protein